MPGSWEALWGGGCVINRDPYARLPGWGCGGAKGTCDSELSHHLYCGKRREQFWGEASTCRPPCPLFTHGNAGVSPASVCPTRLEPSDLSQSYPLGVASPGLGQPPRCLWGFCKPCSQGGLPRQHDPSLLAHPTSYVWPSSTGLLGVPAALPPAATRPPSPATLTTVAGSRPGLRRIPHGRPCASRGQDPNSRGNNHSAQQMGMFLRERRLPVCAASSPFSTLHSSSTQACRLPSA